MKLPEKLGITAPALWQLSAAVLQAAYLAHPARFKGKLPIPPKLPTVVGINLPKSPTPGAQTIGNEFHELIALTDMCIES